MRISSTETQWLPTNDIISFHLVLRLPQKDNKGREAPDLILDTVEHHIDEEAVTEVTKLARFL